MRNILVIEGRQSIGGGQIITKKVCDGLSEENNISVFIPGKENNKNRRINEKIKKIEKNLNSSNFNCYNG